jgi:hypothetical protein
MEKARSLKGTRKSIHRYPEAPKSPEPPEGETIVCMHENSPDRPIDKYVAFNTYHDKECVELGRKCCTEPDGPMEAAMVKCKKLGGQKVEKTVAFEGIRDDKCRRKKLDCCVP